METMKYTVENVLDYIPLLLVLGILAGFGSFTALFGALIISFIFLIFERKTPFILGAAPVFILTLASSNVFLGGKSDTLFALLFVSSFILIIFSLFFEKLFLNIPKPVSKGFMAGCYIGGIILCVPLIFGQKTFSAVSLMAITGYGIFDEVGEAALVCALLCGVIYYYLSKKRIKFLPPAFCALLAGVFANFLFGFNLKCVNLGFEGFRPVVAANFGHTGKLLFFGVLTALVLGARTSALIRASREKKRKKNLYLIGLSNILGAITGSIPGGINKTGNKNGAFLPVTETVILLIFVTAFNKIAAFIPIPAAAAILAIWLYEGVKNIFISERAKLPLIKLVFLICALVTAYHLILGLLVSILFVLISKKPVKDALLNFVRP